MIFQVLLFGLVAFSLATQVTTKDSSTEEEEDSWFDYSWLKSELSKIQTQLEENTPGIKDEIDSTHKNVLNNFILSILETKRMPFDIFERDIMAKKFNIWNIHYETKSYVDGKIVDSIEKVNEEEINLEAYIKDVEPQLDAMKDDLLDEINSYDFEGTDYVEDVVDGLFDKIQDELIHILDEVKSELKEKKKNMLRLVARIKSDQEGYIKKKIDAYREEVGGVNDIESNVEKREQEIRKAVSEIVKEGEDLPDPGIKFGKHVYRIKPLGRVTRIETDLSDKKRRLDEILNKEENEVYEVLIGRKLRDEIIEAKELQVLTISTLETSISSSKEVLSSVASQEIDEETREYLQKAIEGEIRSYEELKVKAEEIRKEAGVKLSAKKVSVRNLINRIKTDGSWLRNSATNLIESYMKEAEETKSSLSQQIDSVLHDLSQREADIQTKVRNIMENGENYIKNKVDEYRREMEETQEKEKYTPTQMGEQLASQRADISSFVETVRSEPQRFTERALSVLRKQPMAEMDNLQKEIQKVDETISLKKIEINKNVNALLENPEVYFDYFLDDLSGCQGVELQETAETPHDLPATVSALSDPPTTSEASRESSSYTEEEREPGQSLGTERGDRAWEQSVETEREDRAKISSFDPPPTEGAVATVHASFLSTFQTNLRSLYNLLHTVLKSVINFFANRST